jgi:hypothetical protein
MTEKQLRLIELFARKAKIDKEIVIEWVETGKTTINELSQGIL